MQSIEVEGNSDKAHCSVLFENIGDPELWLGLLTALHASDYILQLFTCRNVRLLLNGTKHTVEFLYDSSSVAV